MQAKVEEIRWGTVYADIYYAGRYVSSDKTL